MPGTGLGVHSSKQYIQGVCPHWAHTVERRPLDKKLPVSIISVLVTIKAHGRGSLPGLKFARRSDW